MAGEAAGTAAGRTAEDVRQVLAERIAANLLRAVRTLSLPRHPQVLVVGGPAGDDELLGVLLRVLPEGVTAGRGNVGGTLPGALPGQRPGPPAGHRYAAALGLALALAEAG
ncbi:MAG: hypothetical protein ACLPKI_26480 [Streptosporangiaceae bacterium]